jgi:tocopherol O-methyltransferase
MSTSPQTLPTTESVARHYDELDPFYRQIWGEHVHHGLWRTGREDAEQAVHELIREAARQAEIEPGTRVCDIGCGYGGTARHLAATFQAQVEGITLSSAQHRYAREKPTAQVIIHHGDWLQNSFPDASFDAAISIESSEHMPDIEGFFRQAYRVLKPGGRLVVCAWLSRANPSKWQIRHFLEPICREGRLFQLGTQSEYLNWMEAAGFHMEHSEDVSRQVQRTWSHCTGRLARALLTHPASRQFLFDKRQNNRILALTVFRLWLAYRTGAMKYGIFKARKL